MKKNMFLTLATTSVVIIAGCGQTTSGNQTTSSSATSQSTATSSSSSIETTPSNATPQGDIDAFVDTYLTENRKVTTVQQDTDANIIMFSTAASGKGKYIFEYDKADQSLERYYSETIFQNSEASVETHFIYMEPNKYFAKNDEDKWEAVPEDQTGTLMGIGVVDYFKLVNALADILVKEQGKYEITESHSSYEIVIKDKDFDFQTYFAGILDLSLVELNQSDLEKNITFKVNKDTSLFESVNIKLYYEQENGKIDIDATFTASEWNKASTSVFNEISE